VAGEKKGVGEGWCLQTAAGRGTTQVYCKRRRC